MTTNLDQIFEQWEAALSSKRRRKEFVSDNFDELFEALKAGGATAAEAYTYLSKAVKAHQPTSDLTRDIWKTLRNTPGNSGRTEKEFADKWNKSIKDKGTTSFYDSFPLPKEADDDGEPKLYGDNKISAKEYKLMREHASKFKSVNFDDIKAERSELLTEDELLEIIRKNRKNG